jgi:NOL1/NOP2/fmu family ribosome biogenesis protein
MSSVFGLKIDMVGMRAFQKIRDYVKPTTRMIQTFGHLATKARIDIDDGQLLTLIRRGPLNLELEMNNGYVILMFEGRALGLGLFIDGAIRSQIPKKEFQAIRLLSSPNP